MILLPRALVEIFPQPLPSRLPAFFSSSSIVSMEVYFGCLAMLISPLLLTTNG